MSESTFYSDDQVALLEAHARICALIQRYAHACEALVDSGQVHDQLQHRCKTLESWSEKFEQLIRDQDLLPSGVNVDREDLSRLADRIREWMDQGDHQRLLNALADSERDLLQSLKAVKVDPAQQPLVNQATDSTASMIEDLEKE